MNIYQIKPWLLKANLEKNYRILHTHKEERHNYKSLEKKMSSMRMYEQTELGNNKTNSI